MKELFAAFAYGFAMIVSLVREEIAELSQKGRRR